MKGRVAEFNNLLLEYSSKESKEIIRVFTEKIKKKEEEINTYKREMKDEQNRLQNMIKSIKRPGDSAYDKLKKLKFVQGLETEGDSVKIITKDLIFKCGQKKTNLGPYTINIGKDSGIKVRRVNGQVNGAHHMFVDGNGNLCTGDEELSRIISEWKRAGLVHLVATIIWDILSNYDKTQGIHYAYYEDFIRDGKIE